MNGTPVEGEYSPQIFEVEDDCNETTVIELEDECHEYSSKVNKQVENQIVYTCANCDKLFVTRSDLLSHIKTHQQEKLFQCNICKKKFASPKHIDNRPFVCTTCDKTIPVASVSSSKGKGKKQSSTRNRRFAFKSTLADHLIYRQGQTVYHCHLCDSSRFSKKSLLMQHLLATHPDAQIFACNLCDERFFTNTNLKWHQISNHPAKGITTNKKRSFECNSCNKQFMSKSHLQRHLMAVHSSEKLFGCEICSKKFTDSSHVKRHIITVHKSNPKPFVCNVCAVRFAELKELEEHLNGHKNDYHFVCDICHRGYPTQQSWSQHLMFAHVKKVLVN